MASITPVMSLARTQVNVRSASRSEMLSPTHSGTACTTWSIETFICANSSAAGPISCKADRVSGTGSTNNTSKRDGGVPTHA
jgi:hypothetical protein